MVKVTVCVVPSFPLKSIGVTDREYSVFGVRPASSKFEVNAKEGKIELTIPITSQGIDKWDAGKIVEGVDSSKLVEIGSTPDNSYSIVRLVNTDGSQVFYQKNKAESIHLQNFVDIVVPNCKRVSTADVLVLAQPVRAPEFEEGSNLNMWALLEAMRDAVLKAIGCLEYKEEIEKALITLYNIRTSVNV